MNQTNLHSYYINYKAISKKYKEANSIKVSTARFIEVRTNKRNKINNYQLFELRI